MQPRPSAVIVGWHLTCSIFIHSFLHSFFHSLIFLNSFSSFILRLKHFSHCFKSSPSLALPILNLPKASVCSPCYMISSIPGYMFTSSTLMSGYPLYLTMMMSHLSELAGSLASMPPGKDMNDVVFLCFFTNNFPRLLRSGLR